MVLNVHRNRKVLLRTEGEGEERWGGGGGGGGGQGICIKMGSDESHFNVSVIVRDKVTRRQCPQTTTFKK